MRSLLFVLIGLGLTAAPMVVAQTYVEQGGNLVIEAESIDSPGSNWEKKTSAQTLDGHSTRGYSGEGYLYFKGGSECGSNNPIGTMAYNIRINTAGKYQLYMKAYGAPIETGRDDCANDGFLKVSGQSGCFGQHKKWVIKGLNPWNWSYHMDLDCSDHEFVDAVYNFSAGDYTIYVSGRSKNFLFDRIVLTKHKYVNKPGSSFASWADALGESGAGGTPPTVSLTSPSDGATFNAPATVSVAATASDEDGTISKVELFRNGTLVNADNQSPYSWSLSGLTAGTYTLEAKATDNENNTATSSVTIYVNDANGNFPTIAVNAGGTAYDGAHNISYMADTYSTDGKTSSSTNAISGTDDDAVYQSDRYESSVNYAFSVPNGTYYVTFKFAEVYFTSAGERVFDVSMEGTEVISNLDIFAKVGQNAAYDETHNVDVSDGTLNINLSADVNKAKICGIVISSFDPATVTNPGIKGAADYTLSPADLASVSIYDMSGRLVYACQTRNASDIRPKSLGFTESGVFMMRIDSRTGIHSRKILLK